MSTRNRPSSRCATVLLGALSLVLLLAAGCGSNGPDVNAASGEVRGQILEVTGRSISEVETLRVRDPDGQVWTFTTEGFVGFTPSHLRQHQLFGQEVRVFYRNEGDHLVATSITD